MKRSSFIPKMQKALKAAPAAAYHLARQSLGLAHRPELFYVTPFNNWVTDWVGRFITDQISRQFGWPSHLTSTPQLLRGQVVHYGELGAFLHRAQAGFNRKNTVVVTIFHGDRSPQFPKLAAQVERFLEYHYIAGRVLTACQIMAERLVDWGLPPEKVVCIPLGIDLNHFQPQSSEIRLAKRRALNIPQDAVCIGSFQKDGVGWGEGMQPKLVKGPDIFLETIKSLHSQHKLFVLLTGPARGYVKRGLEALGVSYHHQVLQNYLDIGNFYACLDLYLVASREEGGPKAVLEALATGVPLVSTRVGLAPDVIEHGRNGFLANSQDITALAEHIRLIIADDELRQQLIANGLKDIQDFSWQKIAARYYHELYQPLLEEIEGNND